MKRASKSKTLACNTCNQVFNKPEHLRVSSEQRGNICLLRSVTISHVRRSLESIPELNIVDTSAKPHQCTACGRGFARPDALARHLRVHQPDSITAPLADSPTPNRLFRSDWDFEGHASSSQASQVAPADHNLHQESTLDVPSNSHLDAGIDSERWTFLPTNSDFASDSSSRVGQLPPLADPSPDSLGQGVFSKKLPVIDRALPQWSGMESQWMVSLGSPAAYVPAVTPEILRRALVETISLAGAAASVDLSNIVSELTSQLDPTLFSDRWLDTCHRLFWVKVLPIVPVLHSPTMQCSRIWEPLLISMLTLGSLHIEGGPSKAKVSMHHLQRQNDLTLRVFPCGE